MKGHRELLNHITAAAATGMEQALGFPVDMGAHGRFEDANIMRQPTPIRVSMVEFDEPLADCMVAISSFSPGTLDTVLANAAQAIAVAASPDAFVSPPISLEFSEREAALEELEALWGEYTINFNTEQGDVLLVLGRGLVETLEHLQLIGDDQSEPSRLSPFARKSKPPVEASMLTDDEIATAESPLDEFAFITDSEPAAPTPPAATPAVAATATTDWHALLSTVEVELSAELGRARMSLGAATGLTTNSVLTLDQLIEDPVTVYVNGTLFATARLVVVDDEYGIEIIEILDAAAAQVPSMRSMAA